LYHQIVKYPGKKANELNEQINKSIATTERYLKILKEQGFIEFRGVPKQVGTIKLIKSHEILAGKICTFSLQLGGYFTQWKIRNLFRS